MGDSTQPKKRCSRCDAVKALTEFGINRANKDGREYHCKPCVREKRAQRTPEQVGAARAYQREYARRRREDPETGAAYRQRSRDWEKANPERRRAREKQWRKANPDKVAARNRRHPRGNWPRSKEKPEQGRERQSRRRARIRGTSVGPIDLDAIWTGICALCGGELDRALKHPDPLSPTIDHIVALARGGTHTQDNVQWAHRVCNLRKYINPM